MWFELLKSGEKQRAYRLFRQSIIHRGELAFTPQKSTIVQDTENMFHDNAIYHVLKTSTVNGHFDLYYHPDYRIIHLKSSKPELDRHSVFITEMFRDEYPLMDYDLRNILREEYNSAMQKRKETPSQETGLIDSLRTANRQVHMAFHRFIKITMREILRPAAGISAAYRTEITTDLTNALPKPKSIFPMLQPYPDYDIESIFRYYQDGFRNNLAGKKKYIMEHIINIVVNFVEKLLGAIHPSGNISQSQFVVEERDIMAGLNRTDIEDVIYSAIEENPQDIELFVNNLP